MHDFTPKPTVSQQPTPEQVKLFDDAIAAWSRCLETNKDAQSLFLTSCRRCGLPATPQTLTLYVAGLAIGFSSGVMTTSEALSNGKISVKVVSTPEGPGVVFITDEEKEDSHA
jgi:hypothetical protein